MLLTWSVRPRVRVPVRFRHSRFLNATIELSVSADDVRQQVSVGAPQRLSLGLLRGGNSVHLQCRRIKVGAIDAAALGPFKK